MGYPPANVVLVRLARRFFKRLKPVIPDRIKEVKANMKHLMKEHGKRSLEAYNYQSIYARALNEEQRIRSTFSEEMKMYTGRVMEFTKPKANKYWKKGRCDLDQSQFFNKMKYNPLFARNKHKINI
eukprot:TRINITY_DN8538_c0_g4_i2.p1 TRINITY_DN8538_c0_g4~~TRINITY_DN8538_c0_g4_i2.p1  ORF type:complete len:126 (-),score=31.74 TRINITY_DN8538_c0_g4_i2:130-507(-)